MPMLYSARSSSERYRIRGRFAAFRTSSGVHGKLRSSFGKGTRMSLSSSGSSAATSAEVSTGGAEEALTGLNVWLATLKTCLRWPGGPVRPAATRLDKMAPIVIEAMAALIVGVLLPEKVVSKLAGCLESDEEVRYVQLDPERPLAEQGHLDVLLHKLAHEMALGTSAGTGRGIVEQVRELLRERPLLVAVDSLEASACLSNRLAICSRLSEAAERGLPIAQPRFALVSDKRRLVQDVRRAGLRYPVIAKPLVACGRADTHVLCLLPSEDAASSAEAQRALPDSVLVQECVPHGGVLIKAYAVGGQLHTSTRRSLPDEALARVSARHACVFDSQEPLPTLADMCPGAAPAEQSHGKRQGEEGGEAGPHEAGALGGLSAPTLRRLADALCGAFGGLVLFGFDVIVERESGRALVIDVNSLPFSASTFPGLGAALKAALIHAHERQQLRCRSGGL